MSLSVEYLNSAKEIYDLSFERIREEADLSDFPKELQDIIVRMIHSCGMVDIFKDIVYRTPIVETAFESLNKSRPILVDSFMLKSAILSHVPQQNEIICTLKDELTLAISKEKSSTLSAASVELWREYIQDSIIIIGNAPTSLFRLLELLHNEEMPIPSMIIATPVGFVGAKESKDALIRYSPVPFITVRGRIGGSAIAAAAMNAILVRYKNYQ